MLTITRDWAGEKGNEELFFNEYRVLVWNDEQVPAMNGNYGCITM